MLTSKTMRVANRFLCLRQALILALVFLVGSSVFSLPAAAIQIATVTGEIANLRSGPGTEYDLLATLEQGTVMEVLAQETDAEDRTWYQVYLPSFDLSGWIASWLVSLEDLPAQPSGNAAIINSTSNLRAGPSADFERILSLEAGTPVKVVGSAWTSLQELWFQIEDPAGDQGWVYIDLLSLAPDVTRTPTELIGKLARITQTAPFRKGPGVEQTSESSLPPGSGGKVLGTAIDSRNEKWLQLELLDNRINWVAQSQCEIVAEWPLAVVEDARWKTENGTLYLTLFGQGYLTGSPTLLANPDRIVLDLPYARFPPETALYSINEGDVLRVRLRNIEGNKVRLFVDLKRPLDFFVADGLPGQLTLGVKVESPHLVIEGRDLPQETQYKQVGPNYYVPLSALSGTFSSTIFINADLQAASLSYGGRMFYFGFNEPRVLAQGATAELISLPQPPLIEPGEIYLPLESTQQVLGLKGSRNDAREILYLDPLITGIGTSEQLQPSGGLRSLVEIQSTAPLVFSQHFDDENNLLYLTVPRAWLEANTVTTTGLLLDVTRSSTMGAGTVTFSLNLGRAQTYQVDNLLVGYGLIVTVDRPTPSTGPKGRRVVLDPGHGRTTAEGYYDSGAVGPDDTKESPINLDIALRLRALLESAGVEVIMTRTAERDPATPDLPGRVAIAERSNAELCLAIHNNSTTNAEVGGTETYYAYDKGLPLAKLVQDELVRALGRNNRGARIPSWRMAMVQDIKSIPAALTEIVFISNPTEEQLLNDPAFRQKAADALYRAIIRYLSNL
ncbi:MAG: N-acetylmuramoyl-L-alanine amidase [bacterium]